MITPAPPKLPLRFFRWYCHPKLRDSIEGDLRELYAERRFKHAKWKADLQFVWDVLLLFRKGIIKPTEGYQNLNNYGMLKNYFTIGWRNLWKNKAFSTINILGLSIGIASCVLLSLFIQDELKYDRHFPDSERIYRVTTTMSNFNGHVSKLQRTSPPIGPALLNEMPEVEAQVRVVKDLSATEQLVRHGEKYFYEKRCYKVDANFFNFFPYEFNEGDATTALQHPQSVILSEALANKIFGREPALNQMIMLNADTMLFRVTGVIKENLNRSHLDADLYLSGLEDELRNYTTWATGNFVFTYVKMKPHATIEGSLQKMATIMRQHGEKENADMGRKKTLGLQPLHDVHLYSQEFDNDIELGMAGNSTYVKAAAVIGLLILVLAGINFVNLTTAKASVRAQEIGVRKVIGADRTAIFIQFMGESLGLAFIAMFLALALVYMALPYFNELAQKNIQITAHQFKFTAGVLLLFAGATGLIAGIYPSIILAAFNPAKVLKDKKSRTGSSHMLRKGMVAFQFTMAIALIACILVIQRQLDFMDSKPLGFDTRNKLMLNLRTSEAIAHYAQLKNELRNMAGIADISASSNSPSTPPVNDWNFYPADKSENEAVAHYIVKVDDRYFKMMKMGIIAGRDFSFPSDFLNSDPQAPRKVIVNQTSLSKMGIALNQAIGARVTNTQDKIVFEIVGVVEDFHQFSMHKTITPMIFYAFDPTIDFHQAIVAVDDEPGTMMSRVEAAWAKINPDTPMECTMLKDSIHLQYENDKRTSAIIFYATLLAVFISCLGLYGLSIFITERRTKEIGIRKVMGASERMILAMLSKEIISIVAVSFLIGAPLSYFVIREWLLEFAYHIDPGISLFLLAAAITTLVAIIAVGFESLKAALANPVKSLRSE
ncbi:MAG: ABC transporter permease [Bacteroidetes bacterium]|nr:ABC transporter permease [Bacteroidota bacterium]